MRRLELLVFEAERPPTIGPGAKEGSDIELGTKGGQRRSRHHSLHSRLSPTSTTNKVGEKNPQWRRELYPYTPHLLMLDSKHPADGTAAVPEQWRHIETPLHPSEWERRLLRHPDRAFQVYLLTGIREGFRIGYKYGERQYQSAKANMKSATENPTVVAEYLDRERQAGRLIGPLRKENGLESM